jgi:hypothetical protein
MTVDHDIPSFENSTTNQQALQATRNVQSKTLQALERIQTQAAETQAMGHATLQQMEQHDARMNRTMEATAQLNSNLHQASKLQDRFAVWSLQLGTKRVARQLVKKEKKFFGGGGSGSNNNKNNKNHSKDSTTTSTPPTFKRRGPRPKKGHPTDAFTPPSSIDDIMETSMKESHDMTHQMDRNELFAGVTKQHPSSQLSSTTKSRRFREYSSCKPDTRQRNADEGGGAQLLNDEEQSELAQIDIDDKLVDNGLETLALQMDQLHELSKTMGDTARQQTNKLNVIHKDMDHADDKSRRINQRVKLFTLNRQQKTKERNKFESRLSMQAMACKTAMGI